MEKERTRRGWLRGVLVTLVTVAVLLLALQLSGTEASAQTVSTTEFGGDWKWDDSDGLRFKWMYYKLVNQKTGAVIPKGWHLVDGCWYYFEDGGYIFDNAHDGYYIGNAPYGMYYDDLDPITYSWKKDSNGWRYVTDYQFEDGFPSYFQNAIYHIDGKVYHFNENGYIPNVRGWYYAEGWGWFYIGASGNCVTGWKKLGGKWYFFDYYTGEMTVRGTDTSPIGQAGVTYSAFDENGVWIQGNGWKSIYTDYVYMKNSKCVTGWQKIGGKWYYFNPSNAVMAASVYYDGEDEYHRYAYVDGYYMDTNGVCRDGGYKWQKDSKGWWYGKGSYYEKGAEALIDNCYCEFDDEGYLIEFSNPATGEYWSKKN